MAIIKKIHSFIYIACNMPLILVCSEQQVPVTPGTVAAVAQLVMLGGQVPVPGGKSYACEVCHAIIQGYDEFLRHKRTHQVLPFSCTFPGCDYASKFQYNLKRHEGTHTETEERPYVCDRCGKSFRQLSDLTEHKKTHTGKRPYVCDQCRKGFTKASHLTDHKRTHSGERPYVCGQCGKGFTVAGHLTDHKDTHTGAKRYVCDQCDKRFTAAGSLRYHKKRSHPDAMMTPGAQAAVQALMAIGSQAL